MLECKSYENDARNFTLYINGYFIPWIEQQRANGKIKQGKLFELITLLFIGNTTVTASKLGEMYVKENEREMDYDGEID